MNTILVDSKKVSWYTDLRLVFKSFGGRQKDYNWLITDLELNDEIENVFPNCKEGVVWITGEELTEIVFNREIQFIWGVLSGFEKEISVNKDCLEVIPFANGNPNFWGNSPQIQHPLAIVELVCWDSSLTILLTKDDDLTKRFRNYFSDAKDLDQYNEN